MPGPAGEPATDFLGSLRQVLDPWLAGRLVSQELAADLLWTSPRSLRSRLAGEPSLRAGDPLDGHLVLGHVDGTGRVAAVRREACDDCMDCFAVCPEHQVIKPALKGADKGVGPVILSGHCTNCGRCIDVCARDVFEFSTRLSNHSRQEVSGVNHKSEVSS